MRRWTWRAIVLSLLLAAAGMAGSCTGDSDDDTKASSKAAPEVRNARESSTSETGPKPASPPEPQGIVIPGAAPVELAGGFRFTEGPVADGAGGVYFADVRAQRIHRWTPEGGAELVREDSGGANGLALDRKGHLLVCEGLSGRVTSIDTEGVVSVVADRYGGRRFNKPNDLWIDPKGGIYFTDPAYGRVEVVQGGEHVYYIAPDRENVTRVIDDMVRPNGLVGTPDGKTLYVSDRGARQTWRYTVAADGTLKGKTLFAAEGSDGMTMDAAGNVYMTTDAVLVYAPSGELLERIEVPQAPTNLCFTGEDRKTLFITARTSVYAVETSIGLEAAARSVRADRPGRTDRDE